MRITGLNSSNDKHIPQYFQEFQVVEENAAAKLRWRKHSERDHHIVILDPAIERWLYNASSTLNLQDFGFPASLAERQTLITFKRKHSTKLSPEFRSFE